MSSTEISLVATLIAAYKDGIKIADRIKKKRIQKGGALPPAELEKALRDGEVRIAEVRDENRDVKVDVEAQMALKDLIIEVQGTLLHQLVEAELDDNFDDFAVATQMAVRTRRRAINVLNDLYQRTEDEAARARQEDKRKLRLIEEEERKLRLVEEEDRKRRPIEEEEKKRQLIEEEERKRQLIEEERKRQLIEEERKRQLIEEEERKQQLYDDGAELADTFSQPRPLPVDQTPKDESSPRRFCLISEQYSTIGSPALLPSPLSPRLSASPQHYTAQSSPQAGIQLATLQSPLLSAQTPRSRSTWSTSSTTPTSPALAPVPIQPLTKTSNLGGFCKGAWYAQNLRLDKATGKPSLRSYGWAFYCKKCNYRLQADVRDRNHPRFDDRVYQMQTTRFRMLFLLKSHLPLRNPRDPRVYGCLLCALAGTLKRCNGEDHLIEHVQRHAKETFGDTYLDGPVSISPNGVHIESMRSFDLVFGTAATDEDDDGAGGAQWLDGKEVEFALPPPAELDASAQPLTTQYSPGGLFGTDTYD
ncbi:hypothetical protein DV736_g6306, partial [Chaetothyriales sp. CBS 134916]